MEEEIDTPIHMQEDNMINEFKFLDNKYTVVYPTNILNKPEHIKQIYRSGWLMYVDGYSFNDCPYPSSREKVVFYSGWLDAKQRETLKNLSRYGI